MKVTEIYVAVNANRNSTCQIFDCDPHANRVAYGAQNAILIYDLNQEKITHTLLRHQGRVNAVKWCKTTCTVNINMNDSKCQNGQEKNPSFLLSAGNDGNVIAWLPTLLLPSNVDDDDGHLEFRYRATVLEPPTFQTPPLLATTITTKKSVNLIDSCQNPIDSNEMTYIVASAGIDVTCALRLWIINVKNGDYRLIDTHKFCQTKTNGQRNLLTAIRLIDNRLCACALDNSKIVILLRSENDTWQQCHELTGHTDWVTDLDCKTVINCDNSLTVNLQQYYVLASSSQDLTVRLWELSLNNNCQQLTCHLDSIIQGGHEDWIYSVRWHQNGRNLLTASVDRSIILWQFDRMTGMWREQLRLGDVIGFYGAIFNYFDIECQKNKSVTILAVSYYGTVHRWRLFAKNSDKNRSIDSYESLTKIGGHFDTVTDVTWSKNGRVLLSASADRTVRCHAPFCHNGVSGGRSWHEMARPQIHGYAINCLTAVSDDSYASGADEKIVRIFRTPSNFYDNLTTLSSSNCQEKLLAVSKTDNMSIMENVTTKVSMPVLGLSNKYVENDDDATLPIVTKMTAPPTEEFLMEKSLWAESRKLYAHGNEIQCMTVTNDTRILATAAKSTSKRHAVIILWNTATWQPCQKLDDGHQLTVVQMTFAPDDTCLVSVSRDRSAILWTRPPSMTDVLNGNDRFSFRLTAHHDRWHKRIIWTCAFTHDSRYYVTGSRDGRVAWWQRKGAESTPNLLPITVMEFNKTSSVTSLTCAPSMDGEKKAAYFFAIGFECGNIVLCQLLISDSDLTPNKAASCQILMDLSQGECQIARPHGRVNRLTFRPKMTCAVETKGCGQEDEQNDSLFLACASSDMSVRIYEIKDYF